MINRLVGGAPSNRVYYKASKSSYENKAIPNIDGYVNIYDGPTIDAFLNRENKEIIVGIRGTTLNPNDLVADIKIIGNNLNRSSRYIKDLGQFKLITEKYPPSEYSYYLSGHSLGGAIVKEFKREFPFVKEGQTFNSASQPMDLVSQDNNILDNYIDKDFLYNLTGRFIKNTRLFKYKPKETKGVFGWLKQKITPNMINAHKLEQFDFMGKGKNNISVKLFESPNKNKKYRAIFYKDGKKFKHTDFGAEKMSDYTINKDKERKEKFLSRFNKLIEKNKENPYSPITLSHLLLWNKPSLKQSLKDYKKIFNIK